LEASNGKKLKTVSFKQFMMRLKLFSKRRSIKFGLKARSVDACASLINSNQNLRKNEADEYGMMRNPQKRKFGARSQLVSFTFSLFGGMVHEYSICRRQSHATRDARGQN
jgi:hypothetical protein